MASEFYDSSRGPGLKGRNRDGDSLLDLPTTFGTLVKRGHYPITTGEAVVSQRFIRVHYLLALTYLGLCRLER